MCFTRHPSKYGRPVHVENDCDVVVYEVKLMDTRKSSISSTVWKIRNILRLFPSFVISKVIALVMKLHVLARLGRSALVGKCCSFVISSTVWVLFRPV
jgi:hypothetical protein